MIFHLCQQLFLNNVLFYFSLFLFTEVGLSLIIELDIKFLENQSLLYLYVSFYFPILSPFISWIINCILHLRKLANLIK